jgi:tight adherence protein B
MTELALIAFIALSTGGFLIGLLHPWLTGEALLARRVQTVSDRSSTRRDKAQGLRARLMAESKDSRRKQIQESLKQLEESQKKRRKKLTLRTLLMQSGLELSVRKFWIGSIGLGIVLGLAILLAGAPWYVALAAGAVGLFGLPRWFLGYLRKRRQEVFLREFADAIDIMVRGLKAGLPVSDAMKVIAAETPAPVGPEFLEVVEGQRVGIAIDQGIERMLDRMPLAEVNFLSIVMAIQSKTGGNLAEALNNLSKVLRDRKRMKQKIAAVSQEAKASAMIIGSLPFVITGAMSILNPEYLNPLWDTEIGHLLIGGSLLWMGTGVLIMRKMINFDF